MQIKRPNCEACLHEEVCIHKANSEIMVEDIRSTMNYKGKTYAEVMLPFRIDLTCSHFVNKSRVRTVVDVPADRDSVVEAT